MSLFLPICHGRRKYSTLFVFFQITGDDMIVRTVTIVSWAFPFPCAEDQSCLLLWTLTKVHWGQSVKPIVWVWRPRSTGIQYHQRVLFNTIKFEMASMLWGFLLEVCHVCFCLVIWLNYTILEFFYPCGPLKERSKFNISMVPTVIHWEELVVHYVVRLWVRWGLCKNLLIFRVLRWRDGIDYFIPIDEHNNWPVAVTKSCLLNKWAQNSFCNTPDDTTH